MILTLKSLGITITKALDFFLSSHFFRDCVLTGHKSISWARLNRCKEHDMDLVELQMYVTITRKSREEANRDYRHRAQGRDNKDMSLSSCGLPWMCDIVPEKTESCGKFLTWKTIWNTMWFWSEKVKGGDGTGSRWVWDVWEDLGRGAWEGLLLILLREAQWSFELWWVFSFAFHNPDLFVAEFGKKRCFSNVERTLSHSVTLAQFLLWHSVPWIRDDFW